MDFAHSAFLSRPEPGCALARLLLMTRLVHLWPVSVFPPISCYLSLSQSCSIIPCKCVVCGTQHNTIVFNPSSAVTLWSLDRNLRPHGKICDAGTQTNWLRASCYSQFLPLTAIQVSVDAVGWHYETPGLVHLKLMGGSHLCFLNVSLLSCGRSTDFLQAGEQWIGSDARCHIDSSHMCD